MELRVLVADDSAVMRAMVIKSLRLAGLPLGEVHQAADGGEAMRVIEEHWIDLALLDINMPVMNGEALIEQVRARPETADLRVVVVSTESSDTRIERLRSLGAGFVRKPFTPETLRQTILDATGLSDDELRAAATSAGDGYDF